MDAKDNLSMSIVLYYLREDLPNHASKTIENFSNPNHTVSNFMQAVCLLFKNEIQKTLRSFETLCNQAEVYLASTIAMIYAHKKAKNIEKDTVQFLENKLKNERKQGNVKAYYYAGLFHHLTGRNDKAKEYILRALKINSDEGKEELLSLKGWMEVSEENIENALESFDESFRCRNLKLPDALLGKARACMLLGTKHGNKKDYFDSALELINQSVVLYKNFLPGLIEKGYFYMSQLDWEAMFDTCQRILESDEKNLKAIEMISLYSLVVDVDYSQAGKLVGQIITLLNIKEANNVKLYNYYARLFFSTSDNDQELLKQALILQEMSIKFCGDSSNKEKSTYLVGLGDIYLKNKQRDQALECYNAAYDADDTNSKALIGRLRCYYSLRQTINFQNQLSFIQELRSVLGNSLELDMMRVIGKANSKDKESEAYINTLKASATDHIEKMKLSMFSSKYIIDLNINFLLDVVKYFMDRLPCKPMSNGQETNEDLEFTSFLLHSVKPFLPSHLTINFYLANIEYLKGNSALALSLLKHCIQHQPSLSSLHLLMAQIYLYDKNYKQAEQALSVALSHDFKVKEQPVYKLVLAGVMAQEGELDSAIQTLKEALEEHPSQGDTTDERFLMYMLLVEILTKKGDLGEASKVLEAASSEYKDKQKMESLLVEAKIELMVSKGMVDEVFKMLKSINADQDMYLQRMAQIYLEQKNDPQMYIQCYKDLYAKKPSRQTGILLGDAYMNIQMPEKAIEAYEEAMKKNSKDYHLAHKIGEALVRTHQYGKAVLYYECALKQKEKHFLRYDLARLLILLNQREKAEKILRQFVDARDLDENTETVIQLSKCSHLMGEIKKGDEQIEWLEKAKSLQERVLMRFGVNRLEEVMKHTKFAAKINSDLAALHVSRRNNNNAAMCLKEAVRLDPEEAKYHLDLGMCLLMSSRPDECQNICHSLIQSGKDVESATLLLCEVLLRNNEEEEAMILIKKLFNERKCTFELLSKAIDLMKRARRLDESQELLKKLASVTPNYTLNPGYNFCKGIIYWHGGDIKEALDHLNVARKSVGWSQAALRTMVDICSNPENDTIGGNVFTKEKDGEYLKKRRMGLQTAEQLLRDLKSSGEDYDYLLSKLLIKVMMSPRDDDVVNSVLNEILEILKTDSEIVACMYGGAVCYCLLKQTSKAKSILKKLHKMEWNLQDAYYLEKAWLLQVDLLVQKDNYDSAMSILDKCLYYNKSCSKALEYQAYLQEKNQDYKEASKHYQNAWKLNHNPAIGYKLAFNFLNIKEFARCIDVCHQVLEKHPNYPKIEKEILNKARSQIKVA